MKVSAADLPRPVRRGWQRLSDQARQQLITRNRRVAILLALVTVAVAFIDAHVSSFLVSPSVTIVPIIPGGLLLWPRALRVLFVIVAAGLFYAVVLHKAGPG